MTRAVRAMLAISTLVGLTTAPSTAADPPRIEGSIEKVACPFDASKALLAVDCGRLKVPENYDAPGRTIEVAYMIVHPPQNRDPGNPIIFLSGGPGSPSLVYVETLVTLPAIRDVVVDRDWVFFDQRGGGRSVPELYCEPDDDWFRRVKTCRDELIKQDVDLSQYNSARMASDMEALRKALGVHQWHVWGASFGARVAFTFARYYPSSTRSLLVDSSNMPEEQEAVSDLQGAELVLDKIFWKCAADPACSAKYPDLRSRFMAALPRLRQQPLEVDKERFDDFRVAQYLPTILYSLGATPTFEQRVQRVIAYADAAARGDGELMLQIEKRMAEETPARPTFPQQGKGDLGQNLSVSCHEEKAFESVEEYAQAAAKSEFIRSYFGPTFDAEIFATCALWPAGRADAIETTRVYYDGPILAFTGELDPTLSGLSGYKVEMIYANARNVVFRNAGHAPFYIRSHFYSPEEQVYRQCALALARQFHADPQQPLDTRCAEARKLRLVP